MNDRGTAGLLQAETENVYTLDELQKQLEPQDREDQSTIRQCIAGLTGYAARKAAAYQEEQLPTLRRIILEIASFYGLEDNMAPDVEERLEQRYGTAFDRAVTEAFCRGVPELTERERQDVLAGLEMYGQEMRYSGDMEQWAAECDGLANQLRREWQMDGPLLPQNNMRMGGM